MAHCMNGSRFYSERYWCPGRPEICEIADIPDRRGLNIGRIPSYISLVSCSLSVLGSLLIVFSYWKWKDIRTGSRSIVTFLSIADFFTAAGYIIAGGNYLHYYGEPGGTPQCVRFQQVCEMQSFITTWSTMSSFAWTSILAFYLYLTIVRQRTNLALCLIPVGHVVAWILPYVIVYPLLCKGRLGFSLVATSNWCYVTVTRQQQLPGGYHGNDITEITLLALVAGKLWEIITYVIVLVFYGLIKWHIWKETNYSSFPSPAIEQTIRQVDRKLTLIPIVFILLRIWGTVQLFFSLSVSRRVECGCVTESMWIVYYVLGILQAIGDGGQGWGNALLYVFGSKVLRKRLFSCLWNSTKKSAIDNTSVQGHGTPTSTPQHRHSSNHPIPGRRGDKLGIASWLQKKEGGRISFDAVEGGRIVFESPGRARYTPPRWGARQPRNSYVEYEPTTAFSSED